MDTPFAVIVFVAIVLIIGLTVYLSRRSAAEPTESSRSKRAEMPPPPQSIDKEPEPEFGGKPSPPTRSGEGLFEQPPSGGAQSPTQKQPGAVPSPASITPAPLPPVPQPQTSQSSPPKPVIPPDSKSIPPPVGSGSFAPPTPIIAPLLEPVAEEKSDDVPAIPADDDPYGGMDPMSWLETLAKRQGSDLDDLITGANLDIPTLPSDTVVAGPGYTPNTEEVRFTAFYPKEAAVETWYTLLVYAHIEAALSRVQADSARFKSEMGDVSRQAQSSTPAKLARGTEITVVPEMDGVTFNPERITFKWVEDMHRAEFRFKVAQSLAGTAGAGTATIFVGPLIVATIKFGMLFDEVVAVPVADTLTIMKQTASRQTASTTATIYKAEQIFASYSHKDTDIVIACRDAYQALGYEVLIDIDDLRSGQDWNQALKQLIDRADIFQLFWSARSAESKYCRQEWEYALQKAKDKGAGFIRPVYWEKPFVTPPDDLESLHFAYVPLAKPTAP